MSTPKTRGPQSPADRRPNDEPFYVNKHCETCGAKLVCSFTLEIPNIADDEKWYDEFSCPRCSNSIVMDWPPRYEETLRGTGHGKTYSHAEVTKLFGQQTTLSAIERKKFLR